MQVCIYLHKKNKKMLTKSIIEFITISKEFCAYLEISEHESQRVFVEKTQKLLSLLYLKALLLESNNEVEGYCEQYVTEEQWEFVHQNIETTLGELDVYIEVVSPEYSNDEKDTMPISEALTDIYQDIREFTDRMRTDNDEIREVAVYECMLQFSLYWGPRALSVMQEFHTLMFSPNSKLDSNE